MSENQNVQKLPYDIRYEKPAEKFFCKHEDVRSDYEAAIYELFLGKHPEKVNLKTIGGKKSTYYRIRIGDWRVIYKTVKDTIIVINTLLAGPRGDIYKKMGGLK